jgi:hypothetical protein
MICGIRQICTTNLHACRHKHVVSALQELAAMPAQAVDTLGVSDDDLDRQYIMLPTVQLVERAASKFQHPHNNTNPGVMPEWMRLMHGTMSNSEVPRGVMLFLIKVVLHVDRRHNEVVFSTAVQEGMEKGLSQETATQEATKVQN